MQINIDRQVAATVRLIREYALRVAREVTAEPSGTTRP